MLPRSNRLPSWFLFSLWCVERIGDALDYVRGVR